MEVFTFELLVLKHTYIFVNVPFGGNIVFLRDCEMDLMGRSSPQIVGALNCATEKCLKF